jgi:hypothetical protein
LLATTEIAPGQIDILNNPHWVYERARRRVVIDGKGVEATSGCGQQWRWEAAGRIEVDDAFEIASPRPLRAAYLADVKSGALSLLTARTAEKVAWHGD